MRALCLIGMLFPACAAAAVGRVELSVGRIDADGWRLRGAHVEWRADGRVDAEVRELVTDALPEPARIALTCAALRTAPEVACDALQLHVESVAVGSADARARLRWRAPQAWRLVLEDAQLQLSYDSPDGRVAADHLVVRLSGEAAAQSGDRLLKLHARADAGQAYVEPVFADLHEHPLTIDTSLVRAPGGGLDIDRFDVEQAGVGAATLRGRIGTAMDDHAVDIHVVLPDAAGATALYLRPFVAATRLREAGLSGAVEIDAAIRNASPEDLRVRLDQVDIESPGLDAVLTGVSGELRWRPQAPVPASTLQWRSGRLGQLPVGPAQLRFASAGRDFKLEEPARVPLLDGAVAIERLALSAIGSDRLAADVAVQLEPIELRELCRSLGWPEFSGTLSGRLPGLHLHDRRLDIDGTLQASAFDGQIEMQSLTVIDPLGVLPRISTDIRLRRLDLAALTGAFDFGRITGRLDGDIEGLRLLGWAPVAMKARLYSTPGDATRRRISQRAIDSISSIGGGPTGLLSRGFFSLFDDFAYARIGWSCVLDNGICRMDGIGPAKNDRGSGNGYVLVQGSGLPRIDVVGYSRQVSWPVFLAQLRSIGESGPAQLR